MTYRDPEKAREYQRRWRAAHPDKKRGYDKRHYEQHRDAYTERNQKWRQENPAKARAKQARYRARHPEMCLLKSARQRAVKEQVPFALTREFITDLLAPMTCSETGIPLRPHTGHGGPGPWSPTIDRIVPPLGYVPGNVRLVCHSFNTTNKYTLRGHDAAVRERVLRRRMNCTVKRLVVPLA